MAEPRLPGDLLTLADPAVRRGGDAEQGGKSIKMGLPGKLILC